MLAERLKQKTQYSDDLVRNLFNFYYFFFYAFKEASGTFDFFERRRDVVTSMGAAVRVLFFLLA